MDMLVGLMQIVCMVGLLNGLYKVRRRSCFDVPETTHYRRVKMFLRSMRLAVSALLSTLLLSGCMAVVLLNAANEQDNFAKTFSPSDDMSLIYVYLADVNPNISKHLVIDGRVAGMVRPAAYSISNVTPGRHRVGLDHMEADSILLDVERGRVYFVDAHVWCEDGALHARLQLADETTGRQHVMKSSLANIALFGVPLLNDKPTGTCSG